ncbi:C-type lectin domain family 10 member A-like [Xyrichtys novacula]|uniref:C-type lectin domain family 10 member A-like n=1 Tax=Xyrichtys novacula TaxID=13765 RepID=A0AAV1EI20_XYRNO|nr:C-type lectin domain family 10 member A-like [Xyrichtys novacula]
MTDYHRGKEQDTSFLWIKDGVPLPLSVVSVVKRWLFPVLTVVVILILIIVLGATNTKTSNRLMSAEKRISNLSDVIKSLNTSLQRAQETAKEVEKMRFAVENNKDQLISASEALKQMSVVDSLSRSVAMLKCSLDRIVNNRSGVAACCPPGWDQFDFNCYHFSRSSLSWNESRVWCEKNEAHLLILHSDKAWDFVNRRTASSFHWVGLSDWRTGRWEWINQTPYTMERRRWMPGQPDGWSGHGLGHEVEHCAHLHHDGRLNDLHCSTKMRFICQRHSMN